MITYSTRRSNTHWLYELLALLRSVFKSPRKMRSLKHYRASSSSGSCSNVEGGRYALTSGV